MIERLESRAMLAATTPDFLFVEDASNDSVQQFDVANGAYVGSFVATGSAGLHGPRGMVFNQGNLLVVNQNVDLPKNGEVLRFNAQTGTSATALVPASNLDAPFSPSGMVVRDNVAYVADTRDDSPSGRIAKYDATTGAFLGNLAPKTFTGEFRPRGLVFGPDGGLYVSVASMTETNSIDPPGSILRFDVTSGNDRVVAWNDGDGVDESAQGETHSLHNPLGIVFSPNGTIYVTSNRKQANTQFDENTRIVVINSVTGKELDQLELAPPQSTKNPVRQVAQTILFGPDDKLFIPVLVESLVDGSSYARILTYDSASKQTDVFFVSPAFSNIVGFPLFVTFGKTDAASLAYLDANLNPSPVLTGIESTTLSYGIDKSAVLVSPSISVRDRESVNLSSATIQISQNYQVGVDSLAFQNTAQIQGSWNSTTGKLTLVGNAPVAAYQSALRSIRFVNTSVSPTAGIRLVEFQISDGTNMSDVLTRRIKVDPALNEFLYIGDQGDPANTNDDTVKKFDLRSGSLVGSFGTPGQLIGPRGLVFSNGRLLVANQNVQQPVNGEVLSFSDNSNPSVNPLISSNNPAAPFAPRGMVARENILYVADAEGSSRYGQSFPPILAYSATTGEFLNEIVPNACFAIEIHPRGLAFGPDGLLYASYFSTSEFNSSNPPGIVLRFLDTVTGAFEIVAANYGPQASRAGDITAMHNPEGLVFGPDNRLYVTSSSANSTTNGIVVLDVKRKSQAGFIPLGQDYAQALLFGPNDHLYVPTTSGSDGGGSVRVYEASTNFRLLVTMFSGVLKQPWYLTFTKTDGATLAYQPEP